MTNKSMLSSVSVIASIVCSGILGDQNSLIKDGDYAVHGDYNGHPQVVVFVHNLDLLQQGVVSKLQQLI